MAERPLRKKKDLAPTPVAMAMVIGMFQSPLVPLATFWLGSLTWQPMALSFLFSMFFLVRSPGIWWAGIVFNSGLLIAFTVGIMMPLNSSIPIPFQHLGLVGIFSSVLILWMFSLPSARRYYFRSPKTI